MRRWPLSAALLVILYGSGGQSQSVEPSGGSKQQGPLSQAPVPPKDSDFVGAETCETCHSEIVKQFGTNPHSRLALLHGGKGVTCESCHGPGKLHVDGGGDVSKIFQFTQASAEQIDATCLGCHAAAHPNFEQSTHGEAGLSCTSCHSVHSFANEASLLRVSQPKLCYTCHTDVQPAFAQPFHHKVDEGLMRCSDCHDPHGTFQDKQLQSTADDNEICTKCHAETAGPFVFEHPVVKAEGCTTCHSPHGSANPRLLTVSNVNTLCLQCHSGTNMSAFPNAVSETGGPVHNQAAQYVPCTNCHSQIHGSNATYNFFR